MFRKSEAGVSLVEILIATFILFFVITAVMGLMSMAFIMSAGARYQSAATGFANKQLEAIRAMPYSNIGISGGDPDGTLPAEETTVSGGIAYTITRSVVWVDDVADNNPQTPGGDDSDRHDYKDVSVTLAWHTPPSGSESRVSVMTSIRQPWVTSNPPTVDFTADSVPANSIVYGSTAYVPGHGERNLVVQATANDNLDADGKIASLIFYVDGRVLRNLSYTPETASWAPNLHEYTNDAYPWNTLGLDESSTPMYPDGIRELKVEAWDNSGSRDFKIINVVVDNYAPAVPTNLTATLSTANSSFFNTIYTAWTGSKDGTDWTDTYELQRVKNGSSDATVSLAGTLQSYTDSSLTPFTMYSYRMRAVSPRQLASAYTALTATRMTRPKLTGTANGGGNSRTATLTWTPPSFASTDLHYHIYQSTTWTGADLTTEVADTIPHTYTATTWTSPSFSKSNQYYWQVRASCYVGATHISIYSNVIGPSPQSGSYPIPP